MWQVADILTAGYEGGQDRDAISQLLLVRFEEAC
jgi:hypothetical protein